MKNFAVTVSLVLLIGSVTMSTSCKRSDVDHDSEPNQISLGNFLSFGPTNQALTTLHPLAGVGQTRDVATACRLTQGEIAEIHKKGYYYAAVPEKYFQGGQACGKVISATIAGACYENHSTTCLSPNGHHPIDSRFSGNRQIKLVVLDLCGSCLKDALHIDITASAFGDRDESTSMIQENSNIGPLGDVFNFFFNNRGRLAGKTSEDGNYYLNNVKGLGAGETECFDFVSYIKTTTVVWGLPKGNCVKIPKDRAALFP